MKKDIEKAIMYARKNLSGLHAGETIINLLEEKERQEKGCSWCEKPIYIESMVYQKAF